MKNKIHTIKTTALSILAISSITAAATFTTSVQAEPWKTLPPSVCQVHDPGNTKSGQVTYQSEYVKHNDVTGGSSTSNVYCPVKMDDNSPATIGVYVDYSKADNLNCYLYANHFYGLPKVFKTYTVPSGLKKYAYKTIDTGSWWSAQVLCVLGNGDKVHALNYKAL